MNYSIYILYSLKDKKLYVGCTRDIESRIKKHNDGNVVSTKNRRPFILIYSEDFQDKADAFNRERFLKSLWGARFKKKILKEFLQKNRG